MKNSKLLVATVLGIAFAATSSAVACEHNSSNSSNDHPSHWSFLGTGWYHNMLTGHGGYSDDNHGKECDNGHGNDSSGCETKGGSNSGGSNSGGGSTGSGSGSGSGSGTAGSGKGIGG